MSIRVEEVRYVKEFVMNFLKGINYAINGYHVDDFIYFHDKIASGEIDLDKLADDLYYINTFGWASPEIYKQIIIDIVPSFEHAIQGIDSDSEVFYEYVETSEGVERFYNHNMFYAYYPKTRRIYEIIESNK